MSESEGIGPSVLRVEYRGEEDQVPLAKSVGQLKDQIQSRVQPALKAWQSLSSKIEIAVSEYVYLIDESLESQAKRTEDFLKDLGLRASAEGLISRRKGFHPILSDRLSWRKSEPEDEIGDEFLPFERRTFVIGPMTVNQEVLEGESGPTFKEDVEASSFFIENAVAVDGEVLMEAMEKKPGEKVTNLDLVETIESLMKDEEVI